MEKESFFLPLSSPIHTLYVDRNLKWVITLDTFSDITTLSEVLKHVSIKDIYSVNTDGKGIFRFLGWIFSKAIS
jgi:hypothetical protein